MTLSRQLIDLIQNKRYSTSDLEISASFLLDATASIIAGAQSHTGRKFLAWAAKYAPQGDLRNLDQGRLSFIYGVLCHILELDDLHRSSVVHPGCVVAPSILVMGAGGDGVAGLTAFLRGVEATTRVGNAVGPAHYKIWHNTATCGVFGSVVAAGNLLSLDQDQLVHAFGNAGSQAAGFWQFLATGAETKHLHAGRAAEAGVIAAQLAKVGVTGAPAILEGEKGFFAGTCPDAVPDKVLAEESGDWQIHKTSIKPWPCCRHTHPSIDIGLRLHRQIVDQNIKATVRKVTIETYQAALNLCDRPQPKTDYAAKFSLQHCVVQALRFGEVTLEDFSADCRSSNQDFAPEIELIHNPEIEANYPQHWGGRILVSFEDGSVLENKVIDARGDPENRMTSDEINEKAKALLVRAGMNRPDKLVAAILATTTGAAVPDISRLVLEPSALCEFDN